MKKVVVGGALILFVLSLAFNGLLIVNSIDLGISLTYAHSQIEHLEELQELNFAIITALSEKHKKTDIQAIAETFKTNGEIVKIHPDDENPSVEIIQIGNVLFEFNSEDNCTLSYF